jgi:hypothetical protein
MDRSPVHGWIQLKGPKAIIEGLQFLRDILPVDQNKGSIGISNLALNDAVLRVQVFSV